MAAPALDPKVRPLYDLLRLNTRLLTNGLRGVNDFTARRRPSTKVNNIAFLALHLIDARAYLGRFLGLGVESPFHALTNEVETVEQLRQIPPIDAMHAAWRDVSDLVGQRLEELDPGELDQPARVELPIDDPTLLAGATFLLQHEAYHIGQVALLRKLFGLPAINYT